jgi:hypothetical protein
VGDFLEAMGPVVASAGEHGNRLVGHVDLDAVAVELDFVNPSGSGRHLLDRGRRASRVAPIRVDPAPPDYPPTVSLATFDCDRGRDTPTHTPRIDRTIVERSTSKASASALSGNVCMVDLTVLAGCDKTFRDKALLGASGRAHIISITISHSPRISAPNAWMAVVLPSPTITPGGRVSRFKGSARCAQTAD